MLDMQSEVPAASGNISVYYGSIIRPFFLCTFFSNLCIHREDKVQRRGSVVTIRKCVSTSSVMFSVGFLNDFIVTVSSKMPQSNGLACFYA